MLNYYENIGIGFGPANIALAVSLEERSFNFKNILFLEKNSKTVWQEHMLFEDSDIQNSPFRDLVTPRNPQSKYTFLNFLKTNNRLYDYLNLGLTFPLRIEFNQYISWVAKHFIENVKYNINVLKIDFIQLDNSYYFKVTTTDNVYHCRNIILATGRTMNIPKVLEKPELKNIFHYNSFNKVIELIEYKNANEILIVGGSQSAVEIILYLKNNYKDLKITHITRSFGLKQKDLSPFTGEVYYPEFVEKYYGSNKLAKNKLDSDLKLTNYSASDLDVLNKLYLSNYIDKIQNKERYELFDCSQIEGVIYKNNKLHVEIKNNLDNSIFKKEFDLIVCATGFKNTLDEECYPPVLSKELVDVYLNNDLKVNRNYCAESKFINNKLFLNGLCEKSHGMGDAGSFSMLAYRSMEIVESILNLSMVKEEKEFVS